MSYSVEISRGPALLLFDLRGPAADAESVLRDMEAPLPTKPNTMEKSAAWTTYWIGPERWILCKVHEVQDDAGSAPINDETPPTVSLVEVTDAYVHFSIAGPDALDVMSQAAPLDFDPSAFPSGSASYTEFFRTTALTACESGGSAFAVFVERSYADYVEACLRDAVG